VKLHPPGHPLSLPDGWLHCPPIGELVFNFFVPCKVPLGRRFNEVLPERFRFTPAHALAAAAASPLGRERQVLAIVDLTKTKRYYSPDELRDTGVQYVKVPCSGSDGAPSPLEVNTFCFEVLDVLHRWRPRPNVQPVVLVHCTHGFNRTGAMLVHYAMRMTLPAMVWPDLPFALAEFAKARAPGIYKEDYIACACVMRVALRPPQWSALARARMLMRRAQLLYKCFLRDSAFRLLPRAPPAPASRCVSAPARVEALRRGAAAAARR
jgi:protein-tyrosine phosphatase